jgi:uncharacterized protein
MGRKLGLMTGLLLIALAVPATAQKIAGLDGDWNGALVTPGGTLHLLLHVESTATATSATLTSLDQGNAQVPVASVARNGNEVTLDLPLANAGYKGTLAGDTLTGTWTQGTGSTSLILTRPRTER